MMAASYAAVVGVLVASGVYLLLRARTFPVVLGLTMLSYAVNLFLFASGRLTPDSAPLVIKGIVDPPDPLPQALVLTAIVIGFGMTAFAIALAVRARGELETDHVDGEERT
jgi:multicomponent K+:H+ antiporter subunit C